MSAVYFAVLAYYGLSEPEQIQRAWEAPAVDPALLKPIFLIYLQLLIVNAVALFFSTFTSPLLAAAFSLGLWIAGHFNADFRAFDKVVEAAPAAFLQGASQGDMDMSTSINFPQSQVPYQRVEKQLALVGDGAIIGGGVNGYMVDKKTAEAHKLMGIDALKDPKIAALFDTDRSGKATLINCDPGWSCGDVVDFQLKTRCPWR